MQGYGWRPHAGGWERSGAGIGQLDGSEVGSTDGVRDEISCPWDLRYVDGNSADGAQIHGKSQHGADRCGRGVAAIETPLDRCFEFGDGQVTVQML